MALREPEQEEPGEVAEKEAEVGVGVEREVGGSTEKLTGGGRSTPFMWASFGSTGTSAVAA